MKKTIALILALMLLLITPALADIESAGQLAKEQADQLPESGRVVNVYTWTYYIPDEVVALFEEASGIRVNYTPFSSNEEMLAKLQAAPGQYDLIVCSDYIIEIMAENDMLLALDSQAIAQWGNIDPAYQGQYYDPDNAYTVPYSATVPLIVYDPEAVDFELTGYKDLWNEAFAGGLVLIDDMRNLIGMAQKKLGLSLNETDPAKLDEVAAELDGLKGNVVVFNADTPHNALIGGDAIAGVMFGSQIVAAMEDMPGLKVVYPEEGLSFGIDCLVVPKDAPHADATNIFINYLLDGEVSAYASDLIDYGNCNSAAQDYMTDEFKNNGAINVPSELLEDAEMVRSLDGETQALYDTLWTAFKR